MEIEVKLVWWKGIYYSLMFIEPVAQGPASITLLHLGTGTSHGFSRLVVPGEALEFHLYILVFGMPHGHSVQTGRERTL
jgi:hypothetical protein